MSEDSDFNEERLGKLVQLAKHGVGGEKATALKMVKSICAKRGLDFEEVLNGKKVTEYALPYKTKDQETLLAQVICRYGGDSDIKFNPYRKMLFFKCTAEQYFETVNAWNVLWPLYKKEKEKVARGFVHAFLEKHNLYRVVKKEDRANFDMPSEQEMKDRRMGSAITKFMDDAEIRKTLKQGS